VGTSPWSWDALASADRLFAQAETAEVLGFGAVRTHTEIQPAHWQTD
jgi:hypothetical protein